MIGEHKRVLMSKASEIVIVELSFERIDALFTLDRQWKSILKANSKNRKMRTIEGSIINITSLWLVFILWCLTENLLSPRYTLSFNGGARLQVRPGQEPVRL